MSMDGDETEVVEVAEVVTQTASAATTVDRTALEGDVGKGLADVFGDGDTELVGEPEKPAAAPVASKPPAAKPAAPKPAEPTEEAVEAEDVVVDPTAAAVTPPVAAVAVATPALVPAAYRRSLKAYQWTDEEIDSAHAADPANFLRTAAKMHETRNEATRQMSDLGRQLKTAADAEAAAKGKPQPFTKFEKIDIAKLTETYGDEPFVKQLEAMNNLVDFANQVQPWMTASQQRQQQAELDSLGKQIDGYFGNADMAEFADLYGKSGGKLKDEQTAARQKVLDTADLIISGSKQMGRAITLDEALTLAHDAVSAPSRAKVATQKVAKQVQARQAAISLKPSGQRAPTPSKGGDRSALQGNVLAGLAKAFS